MSMKNFMLPESNRRDVIGGISQNQGTRNGQLSIKTFIDSLNPNLLTKLSMEVLG